VNFLIFTSKTIGILGCVCVGRRATERKVRLMNKRKQKVVGAGDRPDDEEAEAEDRVKQEKGIVKKRRTLFF